MDEDEVSPGQPEMPELGPELQEQLSKMVFNALDHGVLLQGPRGRIAAANPAAAEILGLDLEELVGNDMQEIPQILDARGRDLDLEELPSRRAMQTGETQHDVLLCMPQDEGPDRWVEVTARPLRWHGQVMAVVSSLRDVTERHRAEESLRNTEHRQRVVLEHAVGGYAILGNDGRPLDGSGSLFDWWDRRRAQRPVHRLRQPAARGPGRRLRAAGAGQGRPRRPPAGRAADHQRRRRRCAGSS